MTPIQNKMYQYEVAPPPGLWEKIAVDLDEADLEYFYPDRLRQHSVLPPAAAWEKIAGSIHTEEAPVVARRFFTPFLRYAAAAAVVAFLAWGALQLMNTGKTGSNDDMAATTTGPVPDTATPSENTINTLIGESTDSEEAIALTEAEIRDAAALEASKKTYASLSEPVISKMRNVASFYFTPPPAPTGGTRGLSSEDYYITEQPITGKSNADRYIMLMSPDGNIIRISKKLSDLVCCISGEEDDPECIHQIKLLKEKLSNPASGHSSGSFMDILGIVNALENNNHL